MATNRHRRSRNRATVNGIAEDAHAFFSTGPFFSGERFERETTEAERKEIWQRHRQQIIDRFRAERPELSHLKTWGEEVERLKGAADGDK